MDVMDFVKKCPYCGADVVFKNSTCVYGEDYGYLYICSNYPKCNSYVGTHYESKKPLGRLANPELRKLKQKAHKYFDLLWMYKKQNLNDKWARSKAYSWLAREMKIERKMCHIGYFDKKQLNRCIQIVKPYYNKIRIKL